MYFDRHYYNLATLKTLYHYHGNLNKNIDDVM